MYLSRLISMSALAIVLAVPAYSSNETNSNKDAQRQGELEDNRALKKHKVVEPQAKLADVESGQQQVLDNNGNPLIQEVETKQLTHDTTVSRVPKFTTLTTFEQKALIDRANAGDEAAQDEVVYRKYWGRIPIFDLKEINLDTWASLAHKAEQNDSYAYVVMNLQDGGLVQGMCPNLFKQLLTRAESGDASAQNLVGIAYSYGNSVEKSAFQEVEWYRKAAELGNVHAQVNLGTAYMEGEGVVKDAAQAVEWYRKAAEQGWAFAQNNLAMAYWQGTGVEQDAVQAVKWYQKAAELGSAAAQNMLGDAYWFGRGVEQNAVQALDWFTRALEQGYTYGQSNLANAYWEVIGFNKYAVQAVECARQEAAQGIAVAKSAIKRKIIFQPIAPMTSEKTLSQRAKELYAPILQLTAHCQQKMISNKKDSGYAEAVHAIDRLHNCYQPVYVFGDKLSQILQPLIKPRVGFMVTCLKPNHELLHACLNQEKPTSLLIVGDTMTFDEDNVRVAVQLHGYLNTMTREFKAAHKGLRELIRELRPNVSGLHAAQQAILSAKAELAEHPIDAEALKRLKNAEARYQEEESYIAEILAINNSEIDILEGFKSQLDEVSQGLQDLLPSTVGSRNKECLDSPEFSFFKD